MKRRSPIRKPVSTRSVPLCLVAERISFSNFFDHALHDPFSQQPTSGSYSHVSRSAVRPRRSSGVIAAPAVAAAAVKKSRRLWSSTFLNPARIDHTEVKTGLMSVTFLSTNCKVSTEIQEVWWQRSDEVLGRVVGQSQVIQIGICGSVATSPRVESEARRGKAHALARCVRALSIQRLEGSRPRLRRTRALCKFNGGKERRRVVPRLCCRARHVTV